MRDPDTTNQGLLSIKYSFYDQIKFYTKYFFLKLIRIWFEVKTPKFKFFLSEMVYSGSKLFGKDASSKKAFGIEYVETVYGRFFIRPVLLDAACVSPAFERPDIDKCLSIIHHIRAAGKEALFIDVGADLGTYSITVGNRFKTDSGVRVVAFEPAKESLRLLTKNIDTNGLGQKITVHNTALGEQEGQMNLNYNASAPGSSGMLENAVRAGTSHEQVPINRMDQYINGTSDTVAVIKIDVEGFEEKVLRGSGTALKDFNQVFVVVEDFVDQSIVRYLEIEGYVFLTKITPYNSWWVLTAK